MKTYLLSTLLISALFLTGCGSSEPTRDFSGTVTYGGNPVPAGNITLSPDSSRGNHGPGAVAAIRSGKFATEPGKGVVGGAYVLLITGYDGVPVQGGEGIDPTGRLLFNPYEVKVELPNESSSLEVIVPPSTRF